jgi:hypothetical protein
MALRRSVAAPLSELAAELARFEGVENFSLSHARNWSPLDRFHTAPPVSERHAAQSAPARIGSAINQRTAGCSSSRWST